LGHPKAEKTLIKINIGEKREKNTMKQERTKKEGNNSWNMFNEGGR